MVSRLAVRILGGHEGPMTPLDQTLLSDLGLDVVAQHIDERFLGPQWNRLCEESIQHLRNHGRFESWMKAISGVILPQNARVELNRSAPCVSGDGAVETRALTELRPWKKGPFEIFGTFVDAEWRSDLKWDRLVRVASPFHGRSVLDVGTGNGYFLLRSKGAGAAFTLGLEPSAHYCAQYIALQRFYSAPGVALLPLPCEALKLERAAFDSVLSMGVLYHRRNPVEHLRELASFVRSGGELIIETIVVEGPAGSALVPQERYAGMRNVWCVPSLLTVEGWFKELGMKEIRSTRPVRTTSDEQRSTPWTTGRSLSDALDPTDPSRTIEGHPAPERAFIVGCAP
jgi:tRNA (mo5U34)-methyltransferase